MNIRISPAAKESTFWYAQYIGEEFEVIDIHWDANNTAIAYRVNTSRVPGRPHAFVFSEHCDQPALVARARTLYSSHQSSVSPVEG